MDDGFMTGYVAGQNESNSGSGCGAWGDQWIWIIVVFALLFGWGNNGWGGNGGGNTMSYLPYAIAGNGALTRADLCQDMNFQGLENGVRGIQQGLCDGFYAVNTSLLNGFSGVDNAICSMGYNNAQLANGITTAMMQNQNALQTQLANCCCENREGQAQIRYDMATNTCALQTSIANSTRDIVDSQNAGTRAILDYLCQEKISDLQNENQTLKFAASQQAQNAYLVNQLRPFPVASYTVPNPYTGSYGYQGAGCGTGYGCGCACVG